MRSIEIGRISIDYEIVLTKKGFGISFGIQILLKQNRLDVFHFVSIFFRSTNGGKFLFPLYFCLS